MARAPGTPVSRCIADDPAPRPAKRTADAAAARGFEPAEERRRDPRVARSRREGVVEAARHGQHLEPAREARERAGHREREEPQARAGQSDRARGRRSEPGGAQFQAERRPLEDERGEEREREREEDGGRGAASGDERREAHGLRERAALRIIARRILEGPADEAADRRRRDEIQEDRGEYFRHAASRLQPGGRQNPERARSGCRRQQNGPRDEGRAGEKGPRGRRRDRAREELAFEADVEDAGAKSEAGAQRGEDERGRASRRLAERGTRAGGAFGESAEGVDGRCAREESEAHEGAGGDREREGHDGEPARESLLLHVATPAIRRPRVAAAVAGACGVESRPR